jgi:hypothetical protein
MDPWICLTGSPATARTRGVPLPSVVSPAQHIVTGRVDQCAGGAAEGVTVGRCWKDRDSDRLCGSPV